MTRMLVLCGGRSAEHEVSLVSARSLCAALAGSPIVPTTCVISKTGGWLNAEASRQALDTDRACDGGEPPGLALQDSWDVVFPLLHGPNGEDGTVAGLLELFGRAYIGSGVLASALCMDKLLTKDLLRAWNLPQAPYIGLAKQRWDAQRSAVIEQVEAFRTVPLFVKPSNMGSSVGITKVEDHDALAAAIDKAFTFDRRVVIEQAVAGARELEIAVLGNSCPKTSIAGEITTTRQFYDYDAKYTAGNSQLHIPARIPAETLEKLQDLAKRAYTLCDCAGLARIDFFLNDTGIFINELNTMPGFTPLSMYPKLWEACGLGYVPLIAELIDLAQARHRERPVG